MTLQQLRYAVAIAEHKSMNKAAAELFITQPSLSNTIKDLENEIHTEIFVRSNRGIAITPKGEEFLGYARQMLDHYRLIEERYVENATKKKKFSVSMQHYTFAVEAFIQMAKAFGMDEYEFAVHETKTSEVIENVYLNKSEIGIIYKNDFDEKFMDNNSFFFAEEVLSTYDYRQIIKADDRATLLNLMVGLNGYTLCSGIICSELNGDEYAAIPLNTDETMTIGYIKRKRMPLSILGEKYIEELEKYREKVL